MARVHPTALVAAGAELGDGVEIGPYCIVGERVKLGPGVVLQAQVVVEGDTEIGAECMVHPFAAIGGPPQYIGYANQPTRVVIGARNIIREHVTINRGTPNGRGVTIIGSNNYLMGQAHVGHDCVVGDNVILSHGATLGGHVELDDYVIVGGGTSLHQRGRVGRHAMVGGMAAVNRDIIPFGSAYGNPAFLAGLNLVGLRRREYPRLAVNSLRAAFRMLFTEDGATLQERVDEVASAYAASPEVQEVVAFIRADTGRPLCTPQTH